MICTTIQNRNLEQIYEALEQCEMAEIRLDRCELTSKEIDELFTSDIPLVATCRISEIAVSEPSLQDPKLSEQSRGIKAMQIAEKKLIRAIEAGARYVDVELEAQKQMSKRIRQAAHENGTIFIRSYHDFGGTDSLEALKAIVEKCVYHGADVVKIVTTAHSEKDNRKMAELYDWCRNEAEDEKISSLADGGLIAFCMGEEGRRSRLDCLKYGSPYTYAALDIHPDLTPCHSDSELHPETAPRHPESPLHHSEGSQRHSESSPHHSGPDPELPLIDAVAPGQWSASAMRKAVYGDFRFIDTDSLSMPVSKSFAQRAIVAAAMSDGISHLRNYTPCGDNEAALQVARSLGAEVLCNGSELTIKGISACLGSVNRLMNIGGQLSEDEDGTPVLHVGESGLLTRMMIPVMSQLCSKPVTFTGEKTLLGRPLTGAREIMDALGAGISAAEPDSLACGDDDGEAHEPVRVPLKVTGPLNAGRTEISGKHGSQLISGLLMALPFAEKNSTLVVHEPKSIPYMFITLEVLKKFGIKTGNEMLGGRDFLESDGDWSLCTEMVFKIKGGQKYRAADIDLEGDWSAAANFLVAGALFGKVEIQGLDTTSLQADLSIMDILMDAGASLSQLDGDKGNITVQRAPLKAFKVDASNCPDLFPVISVLAAFCQGTSRLAGVGRLANKESDRSKAIVEMLTQMGVRASVEGDEMVIEGHSLAQRLLASADRQLSASDGKTSAFGEQPSAEGGAIGLLKGGRYTSYHDHRMVMALKVASLGADGPIEIDDEECVAKSFPQFHSAYEVLVK